MIRLRLKRGNAAYDIMQKTDAPQLAILDWEMPGLDGAAQRNKDAIKDIDDVAKLFLSQQLAEAQELAGQIQQKIDNK